MKQTNVIFTIGLVDGPARQKIGLAELVEPQYVGHEAGDSGELANAVDDRVTRYFSEGVSTHFQQEPNRMAIIRVAPSQIAWITAELAQGEEVGRQSTSA